MPSTRSKSKPFKGKILNATKVPYYSNTGILRHYYIGIFYDHPEFAGRMGHTSYVIKERKLKNGVLSIETLNSRYHIV